jgi:hypothetical protein
MFSKRLDVRDVLEYVLDALPETLFPMFWKGARRARAELAPGSPRLTIEPPRERRSSQFIGHTGFTTSSSGAKKGLCAPVGSPSLASLVPEPIDLKYEGSITPPMPGTG